MRYFLFKNNECRHLGSTLSPSPTSWPSWGWSSTWARQSRASVSSAGLKASPKDEVNLFEFVKIENYGKKLNPIVFLSTSLLYPVLYTLPYAGHFCTAAPLAIFLIARAPVFPRPFLLPRALPPTWERRCHALGGTAAAGRATPLAPFACER